VSILWNHHRRDGYKCGTPTADLAPVTRVPAGGRRSAQPALAVIFVVEAVAAGAVYWYSQRAGWPMWQVIAAVAAVLVVGSLVTLRVSAAARSGRLRPR
jgi:hypothetical protein